MVLLPKQMTFSQMYSLYTPHFIEYPKDDEIEMFDVIG